MIKYYKLDGDHNPVVCRDIYEMGEWMHNNMDKTVVQKTYIGDIEVSTVFLGLSSSVDEDNPILFETMIFGGKHDQYQERYATWDEAVEGHKIAVYMAEEDK